MGNDGRLDVRSLIRIAAISDRASSATEPSETHDWRVPGSPPPLRRRVVRCGLLRLPIAQNLLPPPQTGSATSRNHGNHTCNRACTNRQQAAAGLALDAGDRIAIPISDPFARF